MPEFAKFPAAVTFSDGRRLRKTAVVVAGERVRVAELIGRTVNVLVDRGDVTAAERQPDRTTLVTCADGSTLRVGKGDGCSCGSPLKVWYSQALRGGR